jgi:glycerate 2-kinase
MTHNTSLRRDAVKVYSSGIRAVSPLAAVSRFCSLNGSILSVGTRAYDLSRFKHIYVIGAGKACAPMASALENILGDRIDTGLISVKYQHIEALSKIKIREAAHPIPDESGLDGAREILDIAQSANAEDLVLCLLSGGGSALLSLPVAGISLSDKQKTNRILLSCGADIHEINTIRKHISSIKGGRLAQAVYPATLETLILSDVIGDDPDVIASGPTVPDSSVFEDCMGIMNKYGIYADIPKSVISHIQNGFGNEAAETPKKDDSVFQKTGYTIIGSNSKALSAAKETAGLLGYKTIILSSGIDGDTTQAANFHAAIAGEIKKTKNPVAPPACILSGGETTVHIKGNGTGGRNMEFALAFAIAARGLKNIVLLSAGTDGTDGPTDAAGAFLDSDTLKRAKTAGIDPVSHLLDNDSYNFFRKTGDLFITGPTNTNVMDLRIMIVL